MREKEMIRIQKIKLTDKITRVRVEYEKKRGLHWDEFTIHSAEQPEPELLQALAGLADEVVKICELDEDDEKRVTVTGVAFSWSGQDQNMGASIIARKSLLGSKAPLNLVTPHKVDKDEADELQQLRPSTVRKLESVINYALRFIDGKRAQQTIFDYQHVEK
jgi:hypothetical protein